MIVGCYCLDIYCDNKPDCVCLNTNYGAFMDQFTGPTAADCIRQAKKSGWKIVQGKHACSPCNRKAKEQGSNK